MTTFHSDILSDTQEAVLQRIARPLSERNFYLAGGTAVALHLGHRRSVDFDWFTRASIPDPMRLAQDLREEGIELSTEQIAPGTLHAEVNNVRASMLEYHYELLQPLEPWSDYSCQVASLDDLACMKLSALAQRGAKKDFIDVYALGTRHQPLPELLGLYCRKYHTDDIAHVLYALSYFDDADEQQTPRLIWDTDWSTIKENVRNWVADLA